MIKLKIRITWPLLFALLLAALIYLARDPGQHQPAHAGRPARSHPLHRSPQREHDGSDYDAATRRLDEEAASAGQPVFDEDVVIEMPQASWRRKE